MSVSNWTAEEDERLKSLMESGLTFSGAAAEMGKTKNSVIGRAQRIGIRSSHQSGWNGVHAKKIANPTIISFGRPVWCDTEVARLKSLRASGRTVAEIAAEMNRSISSIEKALSRNGFRAPQNHRQDVQKRIFNPPAPPRQEAAALNIAFGPVVTSILDLEPHQCRWPIGENNFTYCGADRHPKSPYCPIHHGLAWSGRRATPEERRRAEISMRARLVGGVK